MIQINWAYLAASFGGGILGAAFGALPAFILCGLAITAGSVITLITGDQTFNSLVTWGPFLGPHVAFAGGVAAAAFAAKQGKLESGRDILTPLLKLQSPSVLMIGGVFGVLGCILAWGLFQIPNYGNIPWVNVIALSIVVNTLLIRLIFGETGLFGKVFEGSNRWAPLNEAESLPWHIPPLPLLVISVGIGLPVAYIAKSDPDFSGIIFGITALSLCFLLIKPQFPIIFHIVLAVQLFTSATGNIWWGVGFGILAAFLAEYFACLFLIHGDTHIDPPAMALSIIFFLYPLLTLLGLLNLKDGWPLLFSVLIGTSGCFLLAFLRKGRLEQGQTRR